ncbi:MAG: protein kinase domain-containing protein [Nannocystaceae bacterium]|nr:protein kinase [bacterium]
MNQPGETRDRFSESFVDASLRPRGEGLRGTSNNRAWLSAEEGNASRPVILRPGELVAGSKYRIVRRLGTGGMGVVYEAVHVVTGRRAALKIMRHDIETTPALLELFRHEARVASQIESEHIVQALDFVELPDGRFMYVMEHVEGDVVDLELVDGPIALPRTIAILRQVARGLAAAHDAGVIHRDIKPENIMLESGGERRDHVRILDFGISSIASSVSRDESDVVGTPYYIAPELIVLKDAGPKNDQYSLGCTAFEMLTGQPPFVGDNVGDVLRGHASEDVPPIPGVPPELEAVILRCLQKSPEDRYDDMRDFEAALIEAQHAAGIVTEWDHLPPPDVDPDRRAALIAGGSDAPLPRAHPRTVMLVGAALATAVFVGVGVAASRSDSGPAAATTKSSSEADVAKASIETPAEAAQRLAESARAAAKQGRWVYPPPDQPRATTAYAEVLKLEARGTTEATESAAALRVEFGGELRRVADHYYRLEPDSPLVAELYAEVTIFMPGDPIALRRSGLDASELGRVREEIDEGRFSTDRLLDLQPLAILMESDPQERARAAEAYAEQVADLENPPRYVAEFAGLIVLRSPYAGEQEATLTVDDPPDRPEPADARTVPQSKGPTPAGKREANRLVERGQAHLRAGRKREAQDAFKEAVRLHPRLSAAHDGLAQVHFSRSNFRQAAAEAKKAVALSPGNLDYRLNLGDALFRLQRYEDALKHYEVAANRGREDAKRRVAKTRGRL